jgi:hypothetical protein
MISFSRLERGRSSLQGNREISRDDSAISSVREKEELRRISPTELEP